MLNILPTGAALSLWILLSLFFSVSLFSMFMLSVYLMNTDVYVNLFVFRRYCKFSGDELRRDKLEMIIKYIEYGLQGLDVFTTHCLYLLSAVVTCGIHNTLQITGNKSHRLKKRFPF